MLILNWRDTLGSYPFMLKVKPFFDGVGFLVQTQGYLENHLIIVRQPVSDGCYSIIEGVQHNEYPKSKQ